MKNTIDSILVLTLCIHAFACTREVKVPVTSPEDAQSLITWEYVAK